MKKTDFVAKVSEKTGMTKKDAEKTLDAIIESIEEVLVSGDKLQFVGFGSFEVKERPARMGRNPKTNEPMAIQAAKVPAFKPGKLLKDKLNKD